MSTSATTITSSRGSPAWGSTIWRQVRIPGSDPETLILETVPGNYFQVLGLKPAIGRLFGPEDVPASGEGDAVVVSWSYWNRRFQRDPAILGKRIYLQ